MPYTVADVDKHKKGLTDDQKKKWVSIANGVLKSCKSSGASDCEGKAIRIANSKFALDSAMGEFSAVIPSNALRFIDDEAFAKAIGQDDESRLEMVCYSGGLIRGHWYWGDLAIDLEGGKFPKSKYPILEDHDTDKKIAFTGKPIVSDGKLVIDPEKTTFLDTPESVEFRSNSKKGFPYQASIRAYPTKIQRLIEGEEVAVNKLSMKGPGTVWREWVFKEVSACVFGWDENTKSQAFANDDDVELPIGVYAISASADADSMKGDKKNMTLEELKKDFPDLVTLLTLEVTKDLETKFNQQLADVSAQKVDFEKQVEVLKLENSGLKTKVTEFSAQASEATANKIFGDMLAESTIPQELFSKVQSYIDWQKFVVDGALDQEAFKAKVSDEITDWADKLKNVTIMGKGTSSRQTTEGSSEEKVDDDLVKKMLSFSRQGK